MIGDTLAIRWLYLESNYKDDTLYVSDTNTQSSSNVHAVFLLTFIQFSFCGFSSSLDELSSARFPP